VVLDLTFASRTRADTEANVKSTTPVAAAGGVKRMFRQCQYRWQITKGRAWLLWRNFMGLETFDAVIVESSPVCVRPWRQRLPDAFAMKQQDSPSPQGLCHGELTASFNRHGGRRGIFGWVADSAAVLKAMRAEARRSSAPVS
jgi:hypothetical protein